MTQANTFSLIRDVLNIAALVFSVNPSNGEAVSQANSAIGDLQGKLARAGDNPSLTGTPLNGEELAWIGDLFGNAAVSPAIPVPAAPAPAAAEVTQVVEQAAPVVESALAGSGNTNQAEAVAAVEQAAPVLETALTGSTGDTTDATAAAPAPDSNAGGSN